MATLNKVMLIGRLTKPPEDLRGLPSGGQVIKFRFAVGRSKKNDQGGWDKDPNQLYIDCEAFSRPDSKRNLPELISKYAKQGDMLYIEGRLVFEEWDDKNGGGKRSKHKLVIDSLEFLGGKSDGEGGGAGAGGSAGYSGGGNRGGYDDSGGGGGSRGSGGGGGPRGGNGGGSRQTGGGGGRQAPPPSNDDDYDGGGSGGNDPIPF